MVILRALLGFGIGGSPVAFSILSEFLPKNNRGMFLIFFEAFWTIGTVIEVMLAWAVLPTLGWRWLLGLSSVPLWLLLLCYPFIPESPRYLLISGDYEKLNQLLVDFARKNKASLPPGKLLIDQESGENSPSQRGRLLDLFAPSMRKLTILLWFIWILQAIIYYGNVLFTPKFYGSILQINNPSAPDPSTEPLSSPSPSTSRGFTLNLYSFVLFITIAELPGLVCSAILSEKIGRRKTLSSMLGVCAVAVFGLLAGPNSGWFGLICLCISRICISGALAALWTYTPEAYPTTLRASAVGSANAISKLATIFTPFISTALPNELLYVAVIIFGSCCVAASIACFVLPFDTKDSILPSTLMAFSNLRAKERNSDDELSIGGPSGSIQMVEFSPLSMTDHTTSTPGYINQEDERYDENNLPLENIEYEDHQGKNMSPSHHIALDALDDSNNGSDTDRSYSRRAERRSPLSDGM